MPTKCEHYLGNLITVQESGAREELVDVKARVIWSSENDCQTLVFEWTWNKCQMHLGLTSFYSRIMKIAWEQGGCPSCSGRLASQSRMKVVQSSQGSKISIAGAFKG